MDTYRNLTELPKVQGAALTIGNFDGMHRGHQAVIGRLVEYARSQSIPSAVITFDPHPGSVLATYSAPAYQLIITLDRKLNMLAQCGVDMVLVLKFDRAFSQVPAEDFLSQVIWAHFKPLRFIIGYDHHFGHRRQGDADFLHSRAEEYGFSVEVVEGVTVDGRTVSSSAIRQLLLEGRCDEAEQLLGWTYEITGLIVRGAGRGAELQYPTANLEPDEPLQLLPRDGVYVVSAEIDRTVAFGMGNIGVRPTFGEQKHTIEAHFFDSPRPDLYNRRITLRFHHRLRDEQRFESALELKKQLQQDEKVSLNWITDNHGGLSIDAFD